MNKIYVSLPIRPNAYPAEDRTSWAQISYFVYDALSQNFPQKVTFVPFRDDVNSTPSDILVSCIPNNNIKKRPNRTIIIDNDNFDVNKWKHGIFAKYGLNTTTDHTFQYNDYFENLYGAIIKTNDVAIWKMNNNHPDVLEKKRFLESKIKHFIYLPHPIDKAYFGKWYKPNLRPKMKMLVYHCGWRKNAAQLVDMLKVNFSTDQFTVIDHLTKTDQIINAILPEYAYIAHTSYSEGFPYFVNEFLTQGLILYGHEEWWQPYGYDMLKWTYDPTKQDQNLNNLKKLLNPNFQEEYYKMRNDIVQQHFTRTDNNWNYLTDKLIELVKTIL